MRFSRAYEMGGRLSIRVDGAIAKEMLDTPQNREMIASLSRTYAAEPISADRIDFVEAGRADTEQRSPLDDLTDN